MFRDPPPGLPVAIFPDGRSRIGPRGCCQRAAMRFRFNGGGLAGSPGKEGGEEEAAVRG